MTPLRSKWKNFFKFDVCLIAKKYSQKSSAKQKTLVGCQLLCNPFRSKSPYLNMADDLCQLPDEFTPNLPFVFIHFPFAVNSNTVRFIFAGRCRNTL